MHFRGVEVGKIIETEQDLIEHSYPDLSVKDQAAAPAVVVPVPPPAPSAPAAAPSAPKTKSSRKAKAAPVETDTALADTAPVEESAEDHSKEVE